ncbi:hypothetical protein [Amycolatopsis sp.]|uniref:hypothetical protein n=1 Tax=Amycolatopsis sp. TaxID=37632 RepID=UPI002C9D72BE|nr:hypothetical protein [Amycolatopsis sp.]HVV12351.1 hypothetical protein [Amycolatopsis sp.]
MRPKAQQGVGAFETVLSDYLGLDLDLASLTGDDDGWSRTEAVLDPAKLIAATSRPEPCRGPSPCSNAPISHWTRKSSPRPNTVLHISAV